VDGEMHMIRHTAHPIGFAIALADRTGKKRVGIFPNAGLKPRVAVFGAPDQVEEDVGKRLRNDDSIDEISGSNRVSHTNPGGNPNPGNGKPFSAPTGRCISDQGETLGMDGVKQMRSEGTPQHRA
jgi:hypothetical protein